MPDPFFEEQEEQSRVKADIVVAYFRAWSRIMSKWFSELAFVDLYAGPGRYESGEPSTPLLILEAAAASDSVRMGLHALFNDVDAKHAQKLQWELDRLESTKRLRHRPEITMLDVAKVLATRFEPQSRILTLTFIDPGGYRGLTRELIRNAILPFGCEVIFFFNYNRINAAIDNDLAEPHMNALFSEARLSAMQEKMSGLSPGGREALVKESLGDSLAELGAQYLIPFRFGQGKRARTSHFICFITKNKRGYMIMKDINGRPRYQGRRWSSPI